MTSPPDFSSPDSPAPGPRPGLRLRLWLGCLAGTVLALGGLGALLALDPAVASGAQALLPRLGLVAGLALLVSLALALWIDRGVVGRIRRLLRELHGAPGSGRTVDRGWGELGDLARGVQAIQNRQRHLARAAEELHWLERQIAEVHTAVDRWVTTERWQPLGVAEGALRPLADRLDQGFTRESEVRMQNQQAALQVRNDLIAALTTARESAVQAEHGFVEATALLTTVRELQRLSGELQQTAAPARDASVSEAVEQWRAVAAAAIEDLVAAANQSVEHLAAALLRVREIGEQVHLLANRATLIALNSLIAPPAERSAAPHESAASEMKQLAREVRSATDRVGELSDEVEREVRSATERMRGIRERVVARLQEAPTVASEPVRRSEDAQRVLDRLREMVQDATRKSERLSTAGERSSRAAETLAQKLEDDVRDLEGLAVRLAPAGEPQPPGRPESLRGGGLRVLPSEPGTGAGEAPPRRHEERP